MLHVYGSVAGNVGVADGPEAIVKCLGVMLFLVSLGLLRPGDDVFISLARFLILPYSVALLLFFLRLSTSSFERVALQSALQTRTLRSTSNSDVDRGASRELLLGALKLLESKSLRQCLRDMLYHVLF